MVDCPVLSDQPDVGIWATPKFDGIVESTGQDVITIELPSPPAIPIVADPHLAYPKEMQEPSHQIEGVLAFPDIQLEVLCLLPSSLTDLN